MTEPYRGRRAPHLERFARTAAGWAGSHWAFLVAGGVVVVWALSGPLFHYSDTWLLAINTGTTVVTFLMVFLIQRSQNKESLAIQLKLNELIAAVKGASNRLINVENLTEGEVRELHGHYDSLAHRGGGSGPSTERATVEQVKELQDEVRALEREVGGR